MCGAHDERLVRGEQFEAPVVTEVDQALPDGRVDQPAGVAGGPEGCGQSVGQPGRHRHLYSPAAGVVEPHQLAVVPKTAAGQIARGHLGHYFGHHGRHDGGVGDADYGLATEGLKALERGAALTTPPN